MPYLPPENLDLFFQTLNALRYLHLRGVAHRDLKPENILVESRSPLSINLADFGLSNDKPDFETVCGTQRYNAPEIYLGGKHTALVDLWSLGVIILQYMYGLPRIPGQMRGQHRNSPSRLRECGLACCRRVVDYANDWKSDDLIDLLTTGMLRMRAEERLSANACLTKGCDLGLFHGHSLDLESATPTRQTNVQGGISDDDGSTIISSALWNTEGEVLNQDDFDRTARCALELVSRDGYDPQLRSFETGFEHRRSNVQPPIDHSRPLEAGSKYLGSFRRRRSMAVGPSDHPSSRERTKRRPPQDYLTAVPVSHAFGISKQASGRRSEPKQFRTMYYAVLALLTDLLGSKSQDIDIDDRPSTLIGDLSEYLARLEITAMTLTRNDLSGQTTVATGLDCRESVLASLILSELMNSVADLAAHLLHMVQFRIPRPASTSTVEPDDPPLRAYIITDDNPFQSWTVNSIDSHLPIPAARQYGLTFPSALLDDANVSGCSIGT